MHLKTKSNDEQYIYDLFSLSFIGLIWLITVYPKIARSSSESQAEMNLGKGVFITETFVTLLVHCLSMFQYPLQQSNVLHLPALATTFLAVQTQRQLLTNGLEVSKSTGTILTRSSRQNQRARLQSRGLREQGNGLLDIEDLLAVGK